MTSRDVAVGSDHVAVGKRMSSLSTTIECPRLPDEAVRGGAAATFALG